jgi:serine/threonine protein kinase
VLDRLDETLQQRLEERPPSRSAVIRLLLRCAELLRRAHDRRVSHNDIKAPNFLMSEDGSRMVRQWIAGWRGRDAVGCWAASAEAQSRLSAVRSPAPCTASLPAR